MLLHGGETVNDEKGPNTANQPQTLGHPFQHGRNGHLTYEGRALAAMTMSRFGENARMSSDPTWFHRAEHHQRAIMQLPGNFKLSFFFITLFVIYVYTIFQWMSFTF
ncbi:hypothetical protein Hanom_Chr04g00336541 [Helianthus anomalus]